MSPDSLTLWSAAVNVALSLWTVCSNAVLRLQAEKLMRQIGVKNVKLSEYEMSIAAHLVDPLSMQVRLVSPGNLLKVTQRFNVCVCVCVCTQITWRDIAGLDEVITELKETVILPVQKRHLFQGSKLLQPPKGQLIPLTWL